MKLFSSSLILFTYLILEIRNAAGARDCDNALMDSATVSASSSVSERGPDKARLDDSGAWSSASSDYSQYFTIDFGGIKKVTSITTKGRAHTKEFIKEYKIEYGNNGLDYAGYKDMNGNTRLFKGNVDGNNAKRTVFDTPIIAKFIRINPTRWGDRISLRVELYGCDYVAETVGFSGNGLIRMNLIGREISSLREDFQMRLKTNEANGIILYSKGSQNDVFALQLSDNKLVLTVQLGGSGAMSSMSVGSLLDDNIWHDVLISRNGKFIRFLVDRVAVDEVMETDYEYLNLNREIYIGGVPNFNSDGIIVRQNFSGCIENLYINNSNIIENLKEDERSFTKTNVILSCMSEQIVPVTFKNRNAFIKLKSYQTTSFNISFDFRTFEEFGALLYHKFFTDGYIKLFLEKGKLIIYVKDKESSNRLDTMFDEKMNDGNWHETSLILSKDHIELVVDRRPSITKRIFYMESGPEFNLGGNMPDYVGFLGCMRKIYIESNKIHPLSLSKSSLSSDLLFGACQMFDRCSPNPCRHGGVCKQTANDFTCDCKGTGYTGAVCHTSGNPLSCDDYRIWHPDSQSVNIDIDVDGSGPLKPFPVKCVFYTNGVTETYVGHSNEEPTEVNGFEARGSFIQDITYDAGMDEIAELVNRSYSCKQRIKYRCHNARLFGTDLSTQRFQPFSWWVSRNNAKMDYWGDSPPGTGKCGCGMRDDCFDPKKWCNCDSMGSQWKADEGFIHEKEHLPVRQLRFGDTGTINDDKKGEFTLGPLICEQDKLFDNQVTFRKEEAVLELPNFDIGHSGDIYFQFKTTAPEGVFVHSKGITDYIKVSLMSQRQIQFNFEAGNGPFGVNVETPYALNDDNWHSVLIVKNRKEARVIVDGTRSQGEIKAVRGPSRAMQLSSTVYLGATNEYKDGYIGCMRALTVNGKMIDMKGVAQRGVYYVSPGCVGKCDSSPCLNNGTCIEQYSKFTCNCRWTAFRGTICADEIGAYIRRGSYVQYNFVTTLNTINEHIRIGFFTTNARGLLFAISSHSGEYFNLILANSGHLRIVFDYGFERQEMIVPDRNLANAQHHDIRIERSERGSKLSVYVDNYEPYVYRFQFGANQDNQLNRLKSIYLGGNDSMSANEMFEGCISRVEFNDYYILNLLYQEDKPDNVFSKPYPITGNDCEIEAVTYPPEIPEVKAPRPTEEVFESAGQSAAQASIVYGAVLAVLFLLLILVLILIGRYVSRQKGEYKTHEEVGSKNAPDADTAILHSQTGHDVKKNHEYFI